MSEDERKEDIRRRLSGKSKKKDAEAEPVIMVRSLVDTEEAPVEEQVEAVDVFMEEPVVELTPEEILIEEGWVQYYTRGMAAVLKCEKCGNEITAKSERRKTMPVGDKAYLYCKVCNMSYHHECIGYSVFAKKP